MLGYFMVSLLFFQPALGVVNTLYGTRATYPNILFRTHAMIGKVFFGLAVFFQVLLLLLLLMLLVLLFGLAVFF